MPTVQFGVSLINSASASASKAVNKLLANRPVFDSLLEKGVYTGRALVVSQSGDELFFGPHCLKEITQTHTHTRAQTERTLTLDPEELAAGRVAYEVVKLPSISALDTDISWKNSYSNF